MADQIMDPEIMAQLADLANVRFDGIAYGVRPDVLQREVSEAIRAYRPRVRHARKPSINQTKNVRVNQFEPGKPPIAPAHAPSRPEAHARPKGIDKNQAREKSKKYKAKATKHGNMNPGNRSFSSVDRKSRKERAVAEQQRIRDGIAQQLAKEQAKVGQTSLEQSSSKPGLSDSRYASEPGNINIAGRSSLRATPSLSSSEDVPKKTLAMPTSNLSASRYATPDAGRSASVVIKPSAGESKQKSSKTLVLEPSKPSIGLAASRHAVKQPDTTHQMSFSPQNAAKAPSISKSEPSNLALARQESSDMPASKHVSESDCLMKTIIGAPQTFLAASGTEYDEGAKQNEASSLNRGLLAQMQRQSSSNQHKDQKEPLSASRYSISFKDNISEPEGGVGIEPDLDITNHEALLDSMDNKFVKYLASLSIRDPLEENTRRHRAVAKEAKDVPAAESRTTNPAEERRMGASASGNTPQQTALMSSMAKMDLSSKEKSHESLPLNVKPSKGSGVTNIPFGGFITSGTLSGQLESGPSSAAQNSPLSQYPSNNDENRRNDKKISETVPKKAIEKSDALENPIKASVTSVAKVIPPPKPPQQDTHMNAENHFTVVISKIPEFANVKTLLWHVWGGKLSVVDYYKPRNQAHITFTTSEACRTYLDSAIDGKIKWRGGGYDLHVKSIPGDRITTVDGLTRCLRIEGLVGKLSNENELKRLIFHLLPKWGGVEEIQVYGQQEPVYAILRFCSIQCAVNIIAALMSDNDLLKDAKIEFDHDPCDVPPPSK